MEETLRGLVLSFGVVILFVVGFFAMLVLWHAADAFMDWLEGKG